MNFRLFDTAQKAGRAATAGSVETEGPPGAPVLILQQHPKTSLYLDAAAESERIS